MSECSLRAKSGCSGTDELFTETLSVSELNPFLLFVDQSTLVRVEDGRRIVMPAGTPLKSCSTLPSAEVL
jgi:hypothetical protein